MRILLSSLLFLLTTLTAAAQPDSLDYRGEYYHSRRSMQESIPIQRDNLVMLGNSLTEQGAWSEYFPQCRILNRGIGGDCIAGMMARLDQILVGKPRAIFIMAGVNDLIFSKISPEALVKQYGRMLNIITAASPRTKIYIQSLLPLDESQNEPLFKGKNTRIEAFNSLLQTLCKQRGLPYIDIWSNIADEGRLPAALTVDGIHLNGAGYARWAEVLRPHMIPSQMRSGRVSCDGVGVEEVVVTDGENCVATDAEGRFLLPRNDNARFVYLSTPAGYVSPQSEGTVRFHLPVDAERDSYDFELRRSPSDQTRHGFIVVADPQLFARKEFSQLEVAAQDIRQTVKDSKRPMHGICVGDITSGDHAFYADYNAVMSTTGIAFRNAMGNHDMKIWGRSHETSLAPYEAVYGPCYYSYNVGKIHYVVLNNNFFIGRDWYYIGYLDETQLAWLEKDLRYVPHGSRVVVALHIPTMYKDKDSTPFDYKSAERSMCNYRALHSLLEPYRADILSGHMHTTTNSDIRPGLYEHNIAALSGAWWQGEICTDGTPAGYGVFEADGEQLRWYYKSVGHPREMQLKIYDQADDRSFAGRIVANVWNCDPEWVVEMRVDGAMPVVMERTKAIDPQAQALYADPSKLDHKWITVSPSDHYYTAPLPAGAKRIEVTARDRFGNSYRAEKRLNKQTQ